MNFYFLYPRFLYFLLLIPLLILFYFISSSYSKKRAIIFSNFEALQRISGIEFFSRSFFVLFLDVCFVLSIVFLMAQLHVGYSARTDSFSHVILLDNSRSMSVEDIGISRLEAGKKIAKNFVDSMPSGVEFGVVSFAGDSRIVKRIDSSSLMTKSAVDTVSVSPVEGTVLFNALLLADSLFSGQRKSILLISDGEFSLLELSDVLRYAETNNIVINSVVVGTKEGGRDEFGGLHKADTDVMKALAFNTGGKFFEVDSVDIPREFKEVFVETNREVQLDLTFYLLIFALFLFFINWFLNNFKIRIFP
jgi:Ca-activated chloride channel homolog